MWHTDEKIVKSFDSVVLLNKKKNKKKNRAEWSIGRINDYDTGKAGVTYGFKIKHDKRYIVNKPRQLVFNLEKSLIQEEKEYCIG